MTFFSFSLVDIPHPNTVSEQFCGNAVIGTGREVRFILSIFCHWCSCLHLVVNTVSKYGMNE